MSERFSFETRKPEYSASRFCSQIVQARIGHSNIDNLHGRPFGQNHGPFLHPGYTALFWTLNWSFILHWCLFMCSARWSDLEKLRSQCWHLKGLRPVCLRWCRVSSSDRANRHSHPSQEQLYGFSPGNDKWDNVEIQTAHVIDIPHAPGLCKTRAASLVEDLNMSSRFIKRIFRTSPKFWQLNRLVDADVPVWVRWWAFRCELFV